MQSIRSSIRDRDRDHRDIATSAVVLVALGILLVQNGPVSPLVIGAGGLLGLAVASGDRLEPLAAVGRSFTVRQRVAVAFLGIVAVTALTLVALFRTSLEPWHVLNLSFGTMLGIAVVELVDA
ncbi:hypothetical protein OB955_08955 [Halobacteria archaeon AArc-m2/3/4]|uniref:Uncharacterized protein n=1 Tax=Natronoglomus mannanivorans TaxID=2979990 RepID=A0AAP2Z1P6_9EURY|nr:hypothetical protein [Halobacteria archaeon AArc-xg1-1]MCU4972869.1 hypothetical protein [Halobacteria archaeon AArc-m2/3/4]